MWYAKFILEWSCFSEFKLLVLVFSDKRGFFHLKIPAYWIHKFHMINSKKYFKLSIKSFATMRLLLFIIWMPSIQISIYETTSLSTDLKPFLLYLKWISHQCRRVTRGGGEFSPALFQKLEKSALILGKYALIVVIYGLNFSFKMHFFKCFQE